MAAFGAAAVRPHPLTGGKGGAWRAGDVVLKPAEGETAWRGRVLSALPASDTFRAARPVPAADGTWVVSGWEATRWVPGRTDPTRADDVVRTGIAFHAALAHVPRPSFLDHRDDPWSWGERLAFGEPVPAGAIAPSALLAPLLAARRPVRRESQLVHADLTGNVLFADGLPPAVIDFSPAWRPPGWAAAVVVVDALTWHDASSALLDRWAPAFPEWEQLLLRALIHRIATWPAARWPSAPDEAYRPTVDLVLARS